MKILIAGGAGFIGSNLCREMLSQGHKVLCVDNFLTGSLKNIEEFKKNKKFDFLKWDVIKPLPKNIKVDQVYHMASPASPHPDNPNSIHARPFETMQVNSVGTWNLCEFAIGNRAKFLFASTSECYGEPLVHPQTEEYRGNVSTTGPRSIYDEAKRFGETIVAAFVRSKGLDGRIVRIFNTYGPGMNIQDGRVMVNFIKQALSNEPITIFGDGKQTRSLCYVTDLVAGLDKLMNMPETKGEIVNLGNPDEYTVMELAKIIKKNLGSRSKIEMSRELPTDDPKKRRPDISKAKKLLGWKPKVSLDEGLKKMTEYVREFTVK